MMLLHYGKLVKCSWTKNLCGLELKSKCICFRFRYESNHLPDISKEEEELPPVKSLLQVLYTFPFTLKYQHGAKTLHRLEQ